MALDSDWMVQIALWDHYSHAVLHEGYIMLNNNNNNKDKNKDIKKSG